MPHLLLNLFTNFAEKENFAENAFIVGGAVRDILKSCKLQVTSDKLQELWEELKDIDIVIQGDALNIARRFAEEINGSFVLLEKEFGIARVVKNSQFLDISIMRRDSIYTDLSERDITINAMAIPLKSVKCRVSGVKEVLIDPFNGFYDLTYGIIRMVSEENLVKDPLRLLRVYRFSAALDFSVEEETLNAVRRLARLITSIAAERIAEELRCILRLENSYKTIKAMYDDGIIHYIFQACEELKGDIYSGDLLFCKNTEEVLNRLIQHSASFQPLIRYFEADYRRICLKLSALFSDTEKALQSAISLKMSRKEVEFIHKLALQRQSVLSLYKKSGGHFNKTKAVRFLREFQDDVYSLIILAIAQEISAAGHSAAQLEHLPIEHLPIFGFCQELLTFYHREFKERMKLLPLITGDDIIREFGLKPSPLFKEILHTIEIMTLEGKINSREEALQSVRGILNL